jgi:superfamily II DNA or RNA helicase
MGFILRDYQLDCVEAVMEDLKENDRIGVIQSTGAGKTEQFIEISKRYIDDNPDKIVLVLSHLSILTSQTANRYRKRIPGLSVGILQGQRQPKISDKIVIATIQSAHDETKIRKWLRGRQFKVGLIIADECHRLISTQTFEKARKQHHAKLIGFTATPFRENTLMTNLFGTISYTISMQELIDKKRLVPFELNQIIIPRDTSSDERIMKTLALYLEKEKDNPAVMYWQTVEEARTARNVFESYGISCSVVTGDLVP